MARPSNALVNRPQPLLLCPEGPRRRTGPQEAFDVGRLLADSLVSHHAPYLWQQRPPDEPSWLTGWEDIHMISGWAVQRH